MLCCRTKRPVEMKKNSGFSLYVTHMSCQNIAICMYFLIQVKGISNNISKEKDNSMQLFKTSCIIFVVFVVCWMPSTIIVVSTNFSYNPFKSFLKFFEGHLFCGAIDTPVFGYDASKILLSLYPSIDPPTCSSVNVCCAAAVTREKIMCSIKYFYCIISIH